MQRIRLANSNPHPSPKHSERAMTVRRALAPWWGQEIMVGNPQRPHGETICGTAMVWPIVGPPEFLDVLALHDLTRMACVHCFAVAQWTEEMWAAGLVPQEVQNARIAV